VAILATGIMVITMVALSGGMAERILVHLAMVEFSEKSLSSISLILEDPTRARGIAEER